MESMRIDCIDPASPTLMQWCCSIIQKTGGPLVGQSHPLALSYHVSTSISSRVNNLRVSVGTLVFCSRAPFDQSWGRTCGRTWKNPAQSTQPLRLQTGSRGKRWFYLNPSPFLAIHSQASQLPSAASLQRLHISASICLYVLGNLPPQTPYLPAVYIPGPYFTSLAARASSA